MVERSLFRAVFNDRNRLNSRDFPSRTSQNIGRKMDATRGSQVVRLNHFETHAGQLGGWPLELGRSIVTVVEASQSLLRKSPT